MHRQAIQPMGLPICGSPRRSRSPASTCSMATVTSCTASPSHSAPGGCLRCSVAMARARRRACTPSSDFCRPAAARSGSLASRSRDFRPKRFPARAWGSYHRDGVSFPASPCAKTCSSPGSRDRAQHGRSIACSSSSPRCRDGKCSTQVRFQGANSRCLPSDAR